MRAEARKNVDRTGDRECVACLEFKAATAFYGEHSYCRLCLNAYTKERYHARKDRRPLREWRPARIAQLNSPPPPPPSTIEMLELEFDDIYQEHGFGHLQRAIETARKRVAKRNQGNVAAEGWIV